MSCHFSNMAANLVSILSHPHLNILYYWQFFSFWIFSRSFLDWIGIWNLNFTNILNTWPAKSAQAYLLSVLQQKINLRCYSFCLVWPFSHTSFTLFSHGGFAAFLFRQQNRSNRVVFSVETCKSVFQSSNILTSPSLYIYEILSF